MCWWIIIIIIIIIIILFVLIPNEIWLTSWLKTTTDVANGRTCPVTFFLHELSKTPNIGEVSFSSTGP